MMLCAILFLFFPLYATIHFKPKNTFKIVFVFGEKSLLTLYITFTLASYAKMLA